MTLAQVSNRVANLAEEYDVSGRLNQASKTLGAAGAAARRGAAMAYRAALDHPRTSIGAAIVAAALVGGLLWYMFGDEKHPVQRRRKGVRVRARTERRRRRDTSARA